MLLSTIMAMAIVVTTTTTLLAQLALVTILIPLPNTTGALMVQGYSANMPPPALRVHAQCSLRRFLQRITLHRTQRGGVMRWRSGTSALWQHWTAFATRRPPRKQTGLFTKPRRGGHLLPSSQGRATLRSRRRRRRSQLWEARCNCADEAARLRGRAPSSPCAAYAAWRPRLEDWRRFPDPRRTLLVRIIPWLPRAMSLRRRPRGKGARSPRLSPIRPRGARARKWRPREARARSRRRWTRKHWLAAVPHRLGVLRHQQLSRLGSADCAKSSTAAI